MVKPPALTEDQKRNLAVLEPALRECAKRGDFESAKDIAAEIQELLRSTGHETRLQQAKTWLFQAALESGKLTTAQMGFTGIRKKTRKTTRVYLEATALEAICFLRKGQLDNAKPLMSEAIKRLSNITSDDRRIQFEKRLLARFEQEWTLAILKEETVFDLNIDEVQTEAGRLLRTSTVEEIEGYVANDMPDSVIDRLYDTYDFTLKQLPSADRLRLPSVEERSKDQEIGRTLLDSTKKVLWRSLCDENSAVHKMWFEKGMMTVLDKKVLTGAVVAVCMGLQIGYFALAAALVATILKTGIEIFCDRFQPTELLIERKDKA